MNLRQQFSSLHSPEDWLAFCGSKTWACEMAAGQPYDGPTDRCDDIHCRADDVFEKFQRDDWLECFAAHPPIGDTQSLRMKFAGNRQWSAGEQSGLDDADNLVIEGLAEGNRQYRERFGYLFIVCASGLSAREMLSRLNARLNNDPDDELKIAAAEQRKITHLRIDKFAAGKV